MGVEVRYEIFFLESFEIMRRGESGKIVLDWTVAWSRFQRAFPSSFTNASNSASAIGTMCFSSG